MLYALSCLSKPITVWLSGKFDLSVAEKMITCYQTRSSRKVPWFLMSLLVALETRLAHIKSGPSEVLFHAGVYLLCQKLYMRVLEWSLSILIWGTSIPLLLCLSTQGTFCHAKPRRPTQGISCQQASLWWFIGPRFDGEKCQVVALGKLQEWRWIFCWHNVFQTVCGHDWPELVLCDVSVDFCGLRVSERGEVIYLTKQMAELSRLKKFMLCTFIVAIASFLVMFYYSVSFSKYTRMGVKYVTTITNGNLGRDLHEQALLSNDSSASVEGLVDIINAIERSQPTEKKSLMSGDETALQRTSNSSKSGSTDRLSTEAIKPTTTPSTRQPTLHMTASNTRSNVAQKLCPEKSSSLGKSFLSNVASEIIWRSNILLYP